MRRVSFVVLLALLAGLLAVPAAPAQAALGYVGNMYPPGGGLTTISAGGSLTVYVQVYKGGVTEGPGAGAGISCTLSWGKVSSFGGAWSEIASAPMSFNVQVGNNDEYQGTISPAPGNYEYTASCADQSDGTTRYQDGANGRLTVNTVLPGDIQWDQVLHDSFSADYRSPAGPVTAGTTVRLRLRTAQSDIASARIRVWNDRTNSESYVPMVWDGAFDSSSTYDWWVADLPTGGDPTVLYYFFELNDGADQDFYVDDDVKFYGGGFGAMSDGYDDGRSFQITAYDPAFDVPGWMQRGVVYQIFPDRFRDGDPGNNPPAGRFSYGRAGGAIVRSNDPEGDWNSAVCDPRDTQGAGFNCTDYYGDNFYGGDLKGITEQIENGYLSSLGVTVLYLNPIFRAPSNHKYDTANFLEIDPDFGTLADFQALAAAAEQRGIKLMLDGVFNHTSSDSPYFDYYSRFNAAGALTSPAGPGADDNSGACEGGISPYYSWFYFGGSYGSENGGSCNNGVGDASQSYRAWYGYGSLPKLNSALPQVRQYFYGSAQAVGPYWTSEGASGWRFDVGADVDPGLTNDPGNDYWESFRVQVRNPSLTGKSDVVLLGEEWGDGSPWLLGNEWDSVMNYRFRSAVLSWLFTGCQGNGCTGGGKFQENDSNDFSSSGPISSISPSQFNARLRSIHEDYPPMAFKAMMNLAGSHDTQRVRFLLKKANNDSDAAAVQRMKEWWLFAFTYAGAPTLYYGDEVGLSHDGVWDGGQYQDDPYNRAPFPWPDASGGAYVPDTANLQAFARHMASVRQSYPALQDGDVQHGLVIDDARQLYGFARTNGQQTALVLLNRSGNAHSTTFGGLNAAPYSLPDGTVLVDAVGGAQYTVSGGSVTVSVTPSWGAVLLERDEVETPAAVTGLSAAGAGANVLLSWPAVTTDSGGQPEVVTRYEVYRGASAGFTPGAAPLATLPSPAFGGDLSYSDAGAATGGYSYIVRACNAAGECADTAAVAAAKQTADLAVSAAAGVYGGSAALAATLSADGEPLAGRSVSFSLNGVPAGSATTDASGVATLSASLAGVGAGSYLGGVTAGFAGDGAYNPTSASAALSVEPAAASVSLGGLSATYDGAPKAATATTDPAGLGVSITYDGAAAAPANAGSYAVVATVTDPNYVGEAGGTLEIARADQTVTLTGVPATVPAGASFTVSASASSGLAPAVSAAGACTISGLTVTATAAGTCTVTASQAGDGNYNPAPAVSASATVTAAPPTYSFTGFFQPVDNPPTVNTVNAGRAIPVKFSLGGNRGMAIFADGSPSSGPLACSATAPSDAVETTVTATGNSLSYDAATDQYTFVWKTERSWAGTCRQLVLRFADGTTKTATFRFSR